LNPPKIFEDGLDPGINYTEEEAAEDDAFVWSRFCNAVWDSLAKGAARDLTSFRAVCDRMWRPFVAPLVDNTIGTRNFARLMVSRRPLFQNEEVLMDTVAPKDLGKSSKAALMGMSNLLQIHVPYKTNLASCS
jgi:origin recognition complex subunit 5